jgi:hypothetical protein
VRVVDALLRWVDVDHAPDDRLCEYLPQRLRRLETVPGRARRSLRAAEGFKCMLERFAGVLLGREAAPLHALRTAAAIAIPIGPECTPVGARRFQPQDLTPLTHHRLPFSRQPE